MVNDEKLEQRKDQIKEEKKLTDEEAKKEVAKENVQEITGENFEKTRELAKNILKANDGIENQNAGITAQGMKDIQSKEVQQMQEQMTKTDLAKNLVNAGLGSEHLSTGVTALKFATKTVSETADRFGDGTKIENDLQDLERKTGLSKDEIEGTTLEQIEQKIELPKQQNERSSSKIKSLLKTMSKKIPTKIAAGLALGSSLMLGGMTNSEQSTQDFYVPLEAETEELYQDSMRCMDQVEYEKAKYVHNLDSVVNEDAGYSRTVERNSQGNPIKLIEKSPSSLNEMSWRDDGTLASKKSELNSSTLSKKVMEEFDANGQLKHSISTSVLDASNTSYFEEKNFENGHLLSMTTIKNRNGRQYKTSLAIERNGAKTTVRKNINGDTLEEVYEHGRKIQESFTSKNNSKGPTVTTFDASGKRIRTEGKKMTLAERNSRLEKYRSSSK